MNLNTLLDQLFPAGHQVEIDNNIVYGTGESTAGTVAIVGTENTVIGVDAALALSRRFIEVMEKHPGRPILMMVDNNGQKMALSDELLGLNQYIAHLVQLQDLARRQGHKVIALVYGNSIAGGFIAFGLCAGHTYAMSDSETSVMKLAAIVRVTKLEREYLEELSKSVAVFAPGVENFYLTGGLEEVWHENLAEKLAEALGKDQSVDCRAETGMKRGGRPAAAGIIDRVGHE